MIYADDTQLLIFMRIWNRAVALESLGLFSDDIMSWNLCSMLKCRPQRLSCSISFRIFHLQNRLLRLKSVIITFSLLVLSQMLESPLIHTSPLFTMSATPIALFCIRFILLVESENIFCKRILSALSMPSFALWNSFS